MLIPLTTGDTLQLKLGARLPRPDELPAQAPAPNDDGRVVWVDGPTYPMTMTSVAQPSDYRHPSAPNRTPAPVPVTFDDVMVKAAAAKTRKDTLEESLALWKWATGLSAAAATERADLVGVDLSDGSDRTVLFRRSKWGEVFDPPEFVEPPASVFRDIEKAAHLRKAPKKVNLEVPMQIVWPPEAQVGIERVQGPVPTELQFLVDEAQDIAAAKTFAHSSPLVYFTMPPNAEDPLGQRVYARPADSPTPDGARESTRDAFSSYWRWRRGGHDTHVAGSPWDSGWHNWATRERIR